MAPSKSSRKTQSKEAALVDELAEILDARSLMELELETEEVAIRLSRNATGQAVLATPAATLAAAPAANPAATPAPAAKAQPRRLTKAGPAVLIPSRGRQIADGRHRLQLSRARRSRIHFRRQASSQGPDIADH